MTTGSVIFTPNGAPASSTYSYSTRPRVVPSRKRFPDPTASDHEEYPVCYGNLMYDRRVVRGNTYALQSLPWCPAETDPVEIQKQREAHQKMLARKRAKEESEVHAPQVEIPQLRADVQTELYLEEIADRIIEVDMECQTDAFLLRPDSPLFVPSKTGADVATQIEEGELFDFDIEVRPIVEVLVGKTVEQALLEVTEEEELANLQAHQFGYHELRNAELAEVQRLEQQEIRRNEEKARRKAQQVTANTKSSEVKQKISSRAFSLQYLSNLIPSVFNDLHNKGFFFDIIERDVEKEFLPYLMSGVVKRMASNQLGRVMTDCLINDVVGKRLKDFAENQPIGRLPRRQKSWKNARFPTTGK
ncbi:radial spoke head protein 3 homolog isoform X1 [Podarcis raffonei]|uniref:radial spoke head protein 3 homolog isoform X1 n=2 Tax=Podarcis raffonei TaxID=65483 RepID=UPI00232982BA|nr:radial spoke head protein 3 homolog isoform X1 [Podarcis raffonei]